MRQRRIKNQEEKLAALSGRIVEAPARWKGRWGERFGNGNPIQLEVGCGKGKFITAMAARHPERNFLAVEGQEGVILRALERAEREQLSNLLFLSEYIRDIRELFDPGELSGLYLNFSDPWPKERHARRRLTHPDFLEGYRAVLAPGSFIGIKTDNDGLYAFTLESVALCGMEMAEQVEDLHGASLFEFGSDGRWLGGGLGRIREGDGPSQALAEDGESSQALEEARAVTTEYEDKFRKLGKSIHYVRVKV